MGYMRSVACEFNFMSDTGSGGEPIPPAALVSRRCLVADEIWFCCCEGAKTWLEGLLYRCG